MKEKKNRNEYEYTANQNEENISGMGEDREADGGKENFGKNCYDRISVPQELDDRVKKAIRSVDKKKSRASHRRARSLRGFRYCAAAAAAVLVCMTVGVNTSEVFAGQLGDMPVIGPLARVLTVRSYHENTGDLDIQVNVPQIDVADNQRGMPDTQADAERAEDQGTDGKAQDTETAETAAPEAVGPDGEKESRTGEFVGDINAEIEKIVDDFLEKSRQDFEDFKEAFFATGGTEEEWGDRDMKINVDYEVKYQKGNILSLVLTADEAWVASYGVQYYYNLDLAENRMLTLEDFLGENYVEIANESILAQMKERMAENEDLVYWGVGDKDDGLIEGFTTVDENTSFYINEQGNPVVCFAKYEIAPGFMGVQEFEITE